MEYLKLYKAFYGKRVLVTGHTGFKGSWLSLWLRDLGAEVAGFALDPVSDSSHFDLLELDKDMLDTRGDIRDAGALQRLFQSFQPEVVFHLAAQPLVGRSYLEPRLTFETNVGGSVNLLETVRLTRSVKALVYITSDKCYRNKEWIWGYRESDELGGYDPYSATKAAAELAFSSYWDAFFRKRPEFGAASVRAGNVIGGGDWSANRIIPDCIKALKAGQPVVLRNPGSTRPWQHVLEPLSGYLLLAARLLSEPKQYAGSWNLGPGSDAFYSVKEVAREVVRLWGDGEIRIAPEPGAPKEAGRLHLNCDKARFKLGWSPCWSLPRAIAEAVSWYRDVSEGESVVRISREQIQRYLDDSARSGEPEHAKDYEIHRNFN